MGFNEFLSSIFGNKSSRDMKEIKPWVEKVKAVYPEVAQLDNDGLRAKTEELKAYIRNSATQQREKVENLKATVEATELEKREELFTQIDKLEKEILDNVTDGSIILMHDYISCESYTDAALRRVIPKLKELGYSFVTVSELIGD